MVYQRCVHGMPDPRFCVRCSRSATTPARPRARSVAKVAAAWAPKRIPRANSIDYSIEPDRRHIRLQIGVASNWRQLKKVWGVCEEVRINEPADSEVRVQLKIFPRWGVVAEDPPLLVPAKGPADERILDIRTAKGVRPSPDELKSMGVIEVPDAVGARYMRPAPIRYDVDSDSLEVTIDLLNSDGNFNPALQLRSGRATGAFRVQPVWNLAAKSDLSVEYQLQVLLVIRPLDSYRGPTEWEWLEKHFVSGGRPGSNRRH